MTEKFILLLVDEGSRLHDPAYNSTFASAVQLMQAFHQNGLPTKHLVEGTTCYLSAQLKDVEEVLRSHSVVICGSASARTFEALQALRRQAENDGQKTLVVTDAIEVQDAPTNFVLEQFDSYSTQLCTREAVLVLLDIGARFIYPYAKVDVSASVVVFFDHGRRVLLIKRKFAPHEGCFAFPSGFLRPLLEDLPDCACRELFEETGLRLEPDQLEFINVRSEPGRDPRGHVIDHGYWKLVSPVEEARALQELRAGDDAEEVSLLEVSKAICLPLAADHGSLLIDACRALRGHTHGRIMQPGISAKLLSLLSGMRRKHAT
jgi:ADP-ribose pyrophosphatase YjhB (NUDIX family)